MQRCPPIGWLNAAKEPQNWLIYSGGYFSQRYSSADADHARQTPGTSS